VHLCGDSADDQVVDAVLGQHPEQLAQIQRALQGVAHDLAAH
jgi:hypothetical protein